MSICATCRHQYESPSCFRCGIDILKRLLDKLSSYAATLAACPRRGGGDIAAAVGVAGGSAETLAFVERVYQRELEREQRYVTEARTSLDEQLREMRERLLGYERPASMVDHVALANSKGSVKDNSRLATYGPIRQELKALGFIVSPRGTALGALFPPSDWVRQPLQPSGLPRRSDALMRRYRLVSDVDEPRVGLNRKIQPVDRPAGISNGRWNHLLSALSGIVGCLCISWTRHLDRGQTVWIPFLGISGITESSPDPAFYERFFRHLAVPDAAVEELRPQDLPGRPAVNYGSMIERTNAAAIAYRIRERRGLRLPSRQALLSYVSFLDVSPVTHGLGATLNTAQPLDRANPSVDLCLAFWHSLNCAEPAALAAASSILVQGADVVVCFPYEGINPAGPERNRPKETCPWCAAVELGFRSPRRATDETATWRANGAWPTKLNLTSRSEPPGLSTTAGFDAFDPTNRVMTSTSATLKDGPPAKNKNFRDEAYAEVIQTKIGRVRSMYYLLGLLDPEVIAVDRPLLDGASRRTMTFSPIRLLGGPTEV